MDWKFRLFRQALPVAAIMAITIFLLFFLIDSSAKAADYKTGPYAGVSVGVSSDQITTAGIDLGAQGAVVGALAGWTHPVANMVLGLEGNVGWNGVSGHWTDTSATFTSDGSWYAGLRGRAGLPLGPVLLFAMAGPSFQEMKISMGAESSSRVLLGLTAGAGVDLQLTNTMSIRLAGEHTWWKDASFDLGRPVLLESGREDTKFYSAVIFNLN